MFQTKNVSAFLQQLKFTANGDDVLALATFYVTPISHDLAAEIDGKVADRLFRKHGGDWQPCVEVPTIAFDIQIEPQSLTYAAHKDISAGRGLIPHVAINKLRAFKLFTDDPNFTLAFDCQFRLDDKDMAWLMIHRMKRPLLVTFQALQGKLEFPKPAVLCEICNEPASWRTSPGKSLVCDEHVGAYIGEEVEPLDPDHEAKVTEATKKVLDQAAAKTTKAAAKKKAGKAKRKK